MIEMQSNATTSRDGGTSNMSGLVSEMQDL